MVTQDQLERLERMRAEVKAIEHDKDALTDAIIAAVARGEAVEPGALRLVKAEAKPVPSTKWAEIVKRLVTLYPKLKGVVAAIERTKNVNGDGLEYVSFKPRRLIEIEQTALASAD
jgi:hypothetical protein